MTGWSRLKHELVPLVVIAAISVGFLWRSTLGGKVLLPADLLLVMEPWKHYRYQFPEFHRVSNPMLDPVQAFYPWRKYAGESLRSGTVPLWNPYELCGTPFVANDQSAVFYPETWLHALMPTERALVWGAVLCLFAAGALMYAYLRILALRRSAALLGSIAFMFGGFIVGWLCFPGVRAVVPWLPGMLAAFELSLRRRSVPWAAACALCVALQFLGGNLHISLLVLLLFTAYVVFRCAEVYLHGERSRALFGAGSALGALSVGAGLAAVQILPVLELARMSSRVGGQPYAVHLEHRMPLGYLLLALMPDLFGNPADYNHWGAVLGAGYLAYSETAWYAGVATVIAVPAALLGRFRALSRFWLVMLLVGLGLALGTPLYALFYYLLPGTKALPSITRAVLLANFSLAVMGALGLDALLEWAHEDRRLVQKYAVVAGGAVGLVGLVGGLRVWMMAGALEQTLTGLSEYTLLQVGRFGLFCLVAAGLLALLTRCKRVAAALTLVLLAVDLYWFMDKFTPQTNPRLLHIRARSIERIHKDPGHPRIAAYGANPIHRMSPNTPMIVGLEDIQASESLEIGATRRLVDGLLTDKLGFPQPDPDLPAIDLLGVKYMLSGIELPPTAGVRLESQDDSYLYVNTQALPRAFAISSYTTVPNFKAALRMVASTEFRPAENAVFVEGEGLDEANKSPLPTTPVRVAVHEANHVSLSGEFVPAEVVVLADSYFPGWRAFQDGRECPILRADYALRAVQIQHPCRTVEFVYLPTSYRTGLFLTLVFAGFMAGLAAAYGGRRLSLRAVAIVRLLLA